MIGADREVIQRKRDVFRNGCQVIKGRVGQFERKCLPVSFHSGANGDAGAKRNHWDSSLSSHVRVQKISLST